MQTQEITTRQIYELLLEFKKEMTTELASTNEKISSLSREISAFKEEMYTFREEMYTFREEVNVRFNKVENRLEKVELHLDVIKDRVTALEISQKESKRVLDDLWSNREKVTIGFSKTIAILNAFISASVAMFIALFTGKYVYRP